MQWLDKEDDIQAAMLACPVSCIHWVDKADLPALEFVCQNKVRCPALYRQKERRCPWAWVEEARGVQPGGPPLWLPLRSGPPRATRAGGTASNGEKVGPGAHMGVETWVHLSACPWALPQEPASPSQPATAPSRLQVKRTNVAAMMAAQGGAVDDVWNATAKYLKDRKRR